MSMEERVRVELVVAARRGTQEAFGRLIEIHWDRLVRFARSVVGELEAEDAVQDAILAAWHALPKLNEPEKFEGWLARILFRKCLRRNRGLRKLVPIELLPEQAQSVDTSGDLGVWQVLNRLAPQQRAVLHMTVVEGMTDSEIAKILAIRPASVRSHRRRARESIRKIIKERVT